MLQELQWKQGTNVTNEETFKNYKDVPHVKPCTDIWNIYMMNINAPSKFQDKGIVNVVFEFPENITCQECLTHGTWKVYQGKDVCISGCITCVKENGWTWGIIHYNETKMKYMKCNGSYMKEELSDLDHLYGKENIGKHPMFLTKERIFELGNEIIKIYGNNNILLDERKIYLHYEMIPEIIITKYIIPLWEYLTFKYKLTSCMSC